MTAVYVHGRHTAPPVFILSASRLLLFSAVFLSFLCFDDERLIAMVPHDTRMVMQSSERRMCRGGKGNRGRA